MIGDFVAHRADRTKGPVTQVVRDVFTSADVWLGLLIDKPRSWADFRPAIEANMRVATGDPRRRRTHLGRIGLALKLGSFGEHEPAIDRSLASCGREAKRCDLTVKDLLSDRVEDGIRSHCGRILGQDTLFCEHTAKKTRQSLTMSRLRDQDAGLHFWVFEAVKVTALLACASPRRVSLATKA